MDKPLSEALREYAARRKAKEAQERALDWSLEAFRLECISDAQNRTILKLKREAENAKIRAGLVRIPVVEMADLLAYEPAEGQAHGH